MRLGIMQPYFFPYIGYWQLISAVDKFILLDDVQYIRHGWINRNRVLKDTGWKYITIPLKKHKRETLIKDIEISNGVEPSKLLLNSLDFYKKRALFYDETISLLTESMKGVESNKITDLNYAIILNLARHLGLKTVIEVSSKKGFDYTDVRAPGDWAFEISRQTGANTYINPISGRELFDRNKFIQAGIEILFIEPKEVKYEQDDHSIFEPRLSIIDVLMFNGLQKTKEMLQFYELRR
ncbi:MAG: WbqC family protein [Candidatus Parvarchaeota archaeon]